MKFNSECKLFLSEVYDYDIPSCHYQILKNIGYDMSNIPKDDKKIRNIKIGMLMKNDPALTKLLRSTTIDTIKEYMKINEIKKSDILLNQYDGVLLKVPLTYTEELDLHLSLKNYYAQFLISFQRNSFMALTENDSVIIKGVPNLYEKMEEFMKQIMHINFTNIKSMSLSLKTLKESFYSHGINLFAIPNNKDLYNILLKDIGNVEIGKSTIKLNMIDNTLIMIDDYFKSYIEPFFKSLVYHFF